jgi:hypothetical protein
MGDKKTFGNETLLRSGRTRSHKVRKYPPPPPVKDNTEDIDKILPRSSRCVDLRKGNTPQVRYLKK